MNTTLWAAQQVWQRLQRSFANHHRAPVCADLRVPVRPPRPLRIVRVLESGQPAAQVGRMVISGRLDDVCAELDRLAAAEATGRLH